MYAYRRMYDTHKECKKMKVVYNFICILCKKEGPILIHIGSLLQS